MYKRLAFGFAVILIGLGIVFLCLDILDIAEDYRSTIPIALPDTIFISLLAIPILYFTAKEYMMSRWPEVLGLNLGVFTLGFSILIYGWFTGSGLNAHLMSYDSGILLAAVFHVTGMCRGISGFGKTKYGPALKSRTIYIIYSVIIIVIIFFTWLASLEIINVTGTVMGNIGTRGMLHGISIILILAAVLFFLRYYLKQRVDFYYWYLLGLILLAFGIFFISISQLEGRVAWSGRACQYFSSIYFLAAAIYSGRTRK